MQKIAIFLNEPTFYVKVLKLTLVLCGGSDGAGTSGVGACSGEHLFSFFYHLQTKIDELDQSQIHFLNASQSLLLLKSKKIIS